MILEGLVTTLDADGSPHLAPMGPRVSADMRTFVLRPFPTSRTGGNLRRHPEGVLHVTDDVLLLARAALGWAGPPPPTRPAERVRGVVLADACRWYEFRVTSIDANGERLAMAAETVHQGRGRDWFGLNRAKHAVVEAAVLATRTAFLDLDEVAAEYARLAVVVDKTGGPDEHAAMELLAAHLARERAVSPPPAGPPPTK